MRLFLPRPTIAPFAAMLMAVLGVASTADRAEATCGSHVIIVESDKKSDHPGESPRMPGSPCHGPNCSESPETPFPVSIPLAEPGESKPVTTDALSDLHAATSSASLDPIADDAWTSILSNGIFHPPRLA